MKIRHTYKLEHEPLEETIAQGITDKGVRCIGTFDADEIVHLYQKLADLYLQANKTHKQNNNYMLFLEDSLIDLEILMEGKTPDWFNGIWKIHLEKIKDAE